MNSNDAKSIKRIVSEYIKFMRKTSYLVEEAKRATVLSLKKVLKLDDGEIILINNDGSLEIKLKKENGKEQDMSETENKENEKLTLNGHDITAEELQRQREAVRGQRGARLEEVSKGNFRLRLDD